MVPLCVRGLFFSPVMPGPGPGQKKRKGDSRAEEVGAGAGVKDMYRIWTKPLFKSQCFFLFGILHVSTVLGLTT